MAFPPISTKSTNFTMTPQLEGLLEQKFAPLGKFLDGKTDVRCQVELEKIGDQHSGKIYRAEINVYTKGRVYRAEATHEQMEHSIDEIRDELKRELTHANEKQHSLMKRGGKAIKDMLRFGNK